MTKLLTVLLPLLMLCLLTHACADGIMSLAAPLEEATQTDLATGTDLDDQTILFTFVGDCTTGEDYYKRGYGSSYTGVIGKLGMDYPLSLVADLFAEDDLTFANCEVTYTTSRRPVKTAMALVASPEWANVLALGNIDVVNIFNNHTLDFGPYGRYDTREALEAVGIQWADRSEPWIGEVKGVKVAVVSLCSAMRKDQMNELREYMVTLRQDGVNFIILSCHWGKEDSYTPMGDQLRAEEFLDMGADMIWGHGSHTLQPIQYYNGKLIFYSTCNFTFGGNGSPKDPDTAVFQVSFSINEDKSLTPTFLKVFPFRQCYERDFRPYPVTNEVTRLRILKKLYAVKSYNSRVDSNLPESFLQTGEVDLIAWEAELADRTPAAE